MTLQVVGSTAYGVDLAALAPADTTAGSPAAAAAAAPRGGAPAAAGPPSHYGPPLVRACGDFFRFTGAFTGSAYKKLALLAPELSGPISLLAYALPDKPFAGLLRARRALRDACMDLIATWQRPDQQQQERLTDHHHQQQQQQQQAGGAAAARGGAAEAPAGPVCGDVSSGGTAAVDGRPAGRSGMGASSQQGQADAALRNRYHGDGDAPATNAAAAGKARKDGALHTNSSSSSSSPAPGGFLGLLLSARGRGPGLGVHGSGGGGGGALSDVEVVGQVQTFLLGGYETTANGIAFAVYCIATHPEVEAKLVAEIHSVLGRHRAPTEADLPLLPYTEAVFNEAIRLYPPAHATTRGVDDAPVEVCGHVLPPRTQVILSMYCAHRDPAAWPRAEEFIPERFLPSSPQHPEVCARVLSAHLPFGIGPRLCIGWKFSMQEAKVALATLYQLLTFELEPGQVPLLTAAGITLAPLGGLWVRPALRGL